MRHGAALPQREGCQFVRSARFRTSLLRSSAVELCVVPILLRHLTAHYPLNSENTGC